MRTGSHRLASFALCTALSLAPAAARAAEPLLRGPHPFLKDNEVAVHTGVGVANFFGGVRLSADYGYALGKGFWLDLHGGMVDAATGPTVTLKCGCGRIDKFADVMAGVTYKLRTNIPLVPYARGTSGFLFFFPDGIQRATGLGMRLGLGAKYFLYDWLGFGAELGTVVGVTGLEPRDANGMATGGMRVMRMLEATVGMDLQF